MQAKSHRWRDTTEAKSVYLCEVLLALRLSCTAGGVRHTKRELRATSYELRAVRAGELRHGGVQATVATGAGG